jgi:hypothetical protein
VSKHAEIRKAVAELVRHRGCGCCGDNEKFEAAERKLARLLGAKLYKDKSGVDWRKP